MSDVSCPFCAGTGETAMGGVCAECAGTGTAKKEDIDAVTTPIPNTPKESGRAVMPEYRVSIKHLSDRPVVEPGGDLSHNVVFRIDSMDGALSENWDGGVVRGENLKRCLQLQEKGSVIVSQPKSSSAPTPEKWQEELVNLALDHSASESA